MEAQAIAYTTNYASVVFKLLIECLEANGALLPGQFQKALRATIGHPKAERHRLDYVLLTELLKSTRRQSGAAAIAGRPLTNYDSAADTAKSALGQKLT